MPRQRLLSLCLSASLQALAATALGPFLLAFVHSLAQGAQLERCASALGDEDRATLQQTLAQAAW
ncbi:hypothetical protein T492DRAFT_892329 [Pavlovales sp. CCMP2436]|nr:hypothetical protein T492DRAFT_892329 [Pavlovales sp. CCMP2436]